MPLPYAETVSVPILRMADGAASPVEDLLAVEEPLEIRVGYGAPRERRHEVLAVTMRTPGHDPELALGFLLAEAVIAGRSDVLNIAQPSVNAVRVDLKPHIPFVTSKLERHFFVNSACGVCGRTGLQNVRCTPAAKREVKFSRAMLHRLPETLRRAQNTFQRTGGLHAAALVTQSGELTLSREDVGRHNAVDKLVGAASLAGADTSDKLLLVSGRASYELVQKAVAAGIPAMAAIGAPSSLAVNLAEQFDVTLIGFLRADRFNVYASAWRVDDCAQRALAAGDDSSLTRENSTEPLDANRRPACLP